MRGFRFLFFLIFVYDIRWIDGRKYVTVLWTNTHKILTRLSIYKTLIWLEPKNKSIFPHCLYFSLFRTSTSIVIFESKIIYPHICLYFHKHIYTWVYVYKGSRQTTLPDLRYYGDIDTCVDHETIFLDPKELLYRLRFPPRPLPGILGSRIKTPRSFIPLRVSYYPHGVFLCPQSDYTEGDRISPYKLVVSFIRVIV